MIRATAVTRVLVTGMAYECKDGTFASLAVDLATEERRKAYHTDWDAARNAAKADMLALLGTREFKPGYGVQRRGKWTCHCWE